MHRFQSGKSNDYELTLLAFCLKKVVALLLLLCRFFSLYFGKQISLLLNLMLCERVNEQLLAILFGLLRSSATAAAATTAKKEKIKKKTFRRIIIIIETRMCARALDVRFLIFFLLRLHSAVHFL